LVDLAGADANAVGHGLGSAESPVRWGRQQQQVRWEQAKQHVRWVADQHEPQGPWSLTCLMEAQLGHCTLASKEAGISLGEMLVVAGLRGRRMRRLLGTTPSMSRAWPTVIDANLVFQPAVQEEDAELT
jgi:hypothetical protein